MIMFFLTIAIFKNHDGILIILYACHSVTKSSVFIFQSGPFNSPLFASSRSFAILEAFLNVPLEFA
jgi:hypothetical protein